MSEAGIRAVVGAFADGARDARELGFDSVEVHGAHGYFIDQFFWDGLNQRADSYGVGLAERSRFAVEIMEAIRREVGQDFSLLFRFP